MLSSWSDISIGSQVHGWVLMVDGWILLYFKAFHPPNCRVIDTEPPELTCPPLVWMERRPSIEQ